MSTEYTPEILREIQLVQFEILKDVDKVCRKYNIKYFLSSGTLLGAVRHGGFIPWDDDIDIDMLRDDYDKFLEVTQGNYFSEYFVQNYKTDKNCLNSGFTKIRKNGTIHESEGQKHLDRHKGIAIDIFPIDKVPNSDFMRNVHMKSIALLQQVISIKLKYNYYNQSFIKKNIKIFGSLVLKPFSVKFLGRQMEKIMRFFENKDLPYVSNTYGASYYHVCLMNKEIYGEQTKMEFETSQFTVPKQWEKYLLQIYGDYKKLPPENERFNYQHSITNFCLNDCE